MPFLIVDYDGETHVMEVPGDIRVGEFKQMLQMQVNVPVENQRIEGMREGVTDTSDVDAAVSDGDTLRLVWRDPADDERRDREHAAQLQEMERQQREVQQQHGGQDMASLFGGGGFVDPSAAVQPPRGGEGVRESLVPSGGPGDVDMDADLAAAVEMSLGNPAPQGFVPSAQPAARAPPAGIEGMMGGMPGMGGLANAASAMFQSMGFGGGYPQAPPAALTYPSALRALAAGSTPRAAGGGSISTEIDVDTVSSNGPDAKRKKVDSELGEMLARLVHNQLNADPFGSFSKVLSDVRRERKPLLTLLYNVGNYESVQFLSALTHALEDPNISAITARFCAFMADVKGKAFEEFVEIIENNQDLQAQLAEHCPPQMLDTPFLCLMVPQPNSAVLKVECVLHQSIAHDECVGAMLQVIADHSERLDTEREVGQALDETGRIKAEQEDALLEAMIRDREAEQQRKEEERVQQEAAQRAQEETARREAEERVQAEATAREEKEKADAMAQRKAHRKAQLPPVPEGTAGVVRMMLRLPNGGRVERKFNAGDLFETAYWFMDLSPEVTSQFPDTDACKLVSNFPKKSFSLSADGKKTFKDLQLTGGVALFLEG